LAPHILYLRQSAFVRSFLADIDLVIASVIANCGRVFIYDGYKFLFLKEISMRASKSMRWTAAAYIAKFAVLTADAIGASVVFTRGESEQN
jgi:hypothetical protein